MRNEEQVDNWSMRGEERGREGGGGEEGRLHFQTQDEVPVYFSLGCVKYSEYFTWSTSRYYSPHYSSYFLHYNK